MKHSADKLRSEWKNAELHRQKPRSKEALIDSTTSARVANNLHTILLIDSSDADENGYVVEYRAFSLYCIPLFNKGRPHFATDPDSGQSEMGTEIDHQSTKEKVNWYCNDYFYFPASLQLIWRCSDSEYFLLERLWSLWRWSNRRWFTGTFSKSITTVGWFFLSLSRCLRQKKCVEAECEWWSKPVYLR